MARAGEVLLTEETRRSTGSADGFEIEGRGSRHFRHLPEPVPVFRAIGAGGVGHDLEIDPVCRMAVDPSDAAGERCRRGFDYYFCSPECERAFAADPRRYIATSPAAKAARRGFLINLSVFLVLGTVHLIAWLGPAHPETWPPPPMLFLFIAWAILLGFHFRAVRRLL